MLRSDGAAVRKILNRPPIGMKRAERRRLKGLGLPARLIFRLLRRGALGVQRIIDGAPDLKACGPYVFAVADAWIELTTHGVEAGSALHQAIGAMAEATSRPEVDR